jgi:hypothetical protein
MAGLEWWGGGANSDDRKKIGSSLRIVFPKDGNVELYRLPIGLVRSSLDRIMDPEIHQRTAWA